MTATSTWQNDHNVYVLGAGFSFDARLPLIADFLHRMRDSVEWLQDSGRTEEATAIRTVLGFRHSATASAYRSQLDVENIEQLFSLASALPREHALPHIPLAISATLDFAAHTQPQGQCQLPFDRSWKSPPSTWKDVTGSLASGERAPTPTSSIFECSPYDLYLGLMSGWLADPVLPARNTIITFNYDTVAEDALIRLGHSIFYGFAPKQFALSPAADGSGSFSRDTNSHRSITILKLHGSINWAMPKKRGGRLTVYPSYESLRSDNLHPLLVPPTWNKIITQQLVSVWTSAVQAMSTATRLVIIGYSIPPTDTHFKYLLAAGLMNNISLRKILVVNPASRHMDDRLGDVFQGSFRKSGVFDLIDKYTSDFFVQPDSWRKLGRHFRPSKDQLFRQPRVDVHYD